MRRYRLKSRHDLGAFTLVLFTSVNDIFILKKEKERQKKKTSGNKKRSSEWMRGVHEFKYDNPQPSGPRFRYV